MRPAYSYHRISTTEQDKGEGPERQDTATKAFCERHELLLSKRSELYDKKSGWKGEHLKTTGRNPGNLGLFLDKAKSGRLPKGTVLVVEAFDRLTRLPFRKARRLVEELLENGVAIGVVSENKIYEENVLDESMRYLEIVFHIGRPNEESNAKSRWSSDNWSKKRKRAFEDKEVMSKMVPGWLTVEEDKNGKLYIKPIDTRVRTVEMILDWLGQGETFIQVARKLRIKGRDCWLRSGEWGKREVKTIFYNRAIYGYYCQHTNARAAVEALGVRRKPIGDPKSDWVKYYPPIVDKKTYDAIRSRVSRRAIATNGRPADDGEPNLFRGLMVDVASGSKMRFKTDGSRSYLVPAKSAEGKQPYRCFPYPPLERAFFTAWIDLIPFEQLDERSAQERQNDLLACKRELEELIAVREAQTKAFAKMTTENPKFVAEADKTQMRIMSLEEEIDHREAVQANSTQERARIIRKTIKELRDLRGKELIEKRRELKGLIAEVVEKVELRFTKKADRRLAVLEISFYDVPKTYHVGLAVAKHRNLVFRADQPTFAVTLPGPTKVRDLNKVINWSVESDWRLYQEVNALMTVKHRFRRKYGLGTDELPKRNSK